MTAVSDELFSGCPELTDREQKLQELEDNLAPMVRLALHKGLGLPEVVQWVQQTYESLTEGITPAPPEFYIPQITRLLCAQWH